MALWLNRKFHQKSGFSGSWSCVWPISFKKHKTKKQVEHIDWQIKFLQPWFIMMLAFIIIVSSCRKLVILGMGKSWKSRFHLWLCEIRLWQHVTYLTAARDTCLSVPELTITDVEPGRGGATCPPSAPPTNASTRLFLWVLLAVLLSPAIKKLLMPLMKLTL